MKSKILTILLTSVCLTGVIQQAQALDNPAYTALENVTEFGKYVEGNMSEILESSSDLSNDNAGFNGITSKVVINSYGRDVDLGKKPFATFVMGKCSRDVFVSVKSNQWGESRHLKFKLSSTLKCK